VSGGCVGKTLDVFARQPGDDGHSGTGLLAALDGELALRDFDIGQLGELFKNLKRHAMPQQYPRECLHDAQHGGLERLIKSSGADIHVGKIFPT
jgi:hypothetical protein